VQSDEFSLDNSDVTYTGYYRRGLWIRLDCEYDFTWLYTWNWLFYSFSV